MRMRRFCEGDAGRFGEQAVFAMRRRAPVSRPGDGHRVRSVKKTANKCLLLAGDRRSRTDVAPTGRQEVRDEASDEDAGGQAPQQHPFRYHVPLFVWIRRRCVSSPGTISDAVVPVSSASRSGIRSSSHVARAGGGSDWETKQKVRIILPLYYVRSSSTYYL